MIRSNEAIDSDSTGEFVLSKEVICSGKFPRRFKKSVSSSIVEGLIKGELFHVVRSIMQAARTPLLYPHPNLNESLLVRRVL
jgi:hypothetical protein